MKKILFFNDWHFGDVHMSRNYIKDLIDILGKNDYYSYHTNNPEILKDIDGLTHINHKNGFDLYINTWIGQYMSTEPFQGCNFVYYYKIMKLVYSSLNVLDEIKDINFYLPEIDYTKFEIQSCTNFLLRNKKFILVCNNDVNSGQSINYNMSNLINKISVQFSEYDIVVTNYDGIINKKDNVFFANEIIDKNNNFDLNEISFLSTKASLILGRSSGPYSFSIVKENYIRKVPYICLTNKHYDCWFGEEDSNISWTNNYDDNNVLNYIKNKL